MQKAIKAVKDSDAALCVLSLPESLTEVPTGPQIEIPEMIETMITSDTWFLLNKTDLVPHSTLSRIPSLHTGTIWMASMATGDGTESFLSALAQSIQHRFDPNVHINSTYSPCITRARHRVHLESAACFLEAFLRTTSADLVLGAEELRYAAQAIGKISGAIATEDVLDSVFRDFCIGK